MSSELPPIPSPNSRPASVTAPTTTQTTYVQLMAPPKSASITSMVLGLVSIVMGFTFFLPLIGLIFSFVGLAREPAGRAYAVTGLLLNGFFIAIWGFIVGALLLVVLGTASSAVG